MISRPCEPTGEQADIGDEHPGFGGSDGFLEVLCKSSAPAEPRESAFHHPSARQNLEAFGLVGSLDDLQRELTDLLQRALQLWSGIAAVSEDMAQPRPALQDSFQHVGGAITVLNVGGMDDQTDQQAKRVDDDMTLATHDLLAGIEAPYSAALRGPDRLAVNDAGCGAGLPAFPFACSHDECIADGVQQPLVTPSVEVFLHRRERRKVLRQQPPCAARRSQIQQRVHHLAQVRLARPADAAR